MKTPSHPAAGRDPPFLHKIPLSRARRCLCAMLKTAGIRIFLHYLIEQDCLSALKIQLIEGKGCSFLKGHLRPLLISIGTKEFIS
jgi:hypothetical protein